MVDVNIQATLDVLTMFQRFLLVLSVSLVLLLVSLPAGFAAGSDLDASTFKTTVLDDERVWLVEFYSAMCGGCKEFASTWDRIEKAYQKGSTSGAIASGKINIDDKAGMKIAQELGVLDDGVPHVRLFKNKDDKNGIAVVKSTSSCPIEHVFCCCFSGNVTCVRMQCALCRRFFNGVPQDHE